MRYERDIIQDGMLSLEGGMDSGRAPFLLAGNQAASLENVTVRGGFPATRPGLSKIGSLMASASTHRFQGFDFYEPSIGEPYFYMAVDGIIYRVNLDADTRQVSPADDPSSSLQTQAWMKQVEDTMVIQDGQSRPWLCTGGSIRRSVRSLHEVPVGTCMEYVNGRLWVALPSGRDLIAGDLYGTDTGPLKFTENDYLAEGGTFRIQGRTDRIMALIATAVPDTSLGQGELLAFTEDSVTSINVPTDRDQWKNTAYPVQTLMLLNGGAVGPWMVAGVNSDIFMRSKDGIRTVIQGRRDFASYGNTPVSTEMAEVLDYDDPWRLRYGSAVMFDNRLLMTYGPQNYGRSTVHRGLVSLNFDLIGGMRQKLPPAYEGKWTKTDWYPLKAVVALVNGKSRCFIVAYDASGDTFDLWELTRDQRYDDSYTRIAASMTTRAHPFSTPLDLKQLMGGAIGYDRMAGDIDFTLSFRPDQENAWTEWATYSETAAFLDCDIGEPDHYKEVSDYLEQYRYRRLPAPPETCSAVNNMPYRTGRQFQVKIDWTGFCRIRQLLLKARHEQEDLSTNIED